MASAAAISGIAGLVGQGASLIGGAAGAKQERMATREELMEAITTARENIEGTREQLGLLQSMTGQQLTEHLRGQARAMGTTRASLAGSGVRVGEGGTETAILQEQQRVGELERGAIRDIATVQRAGLQRQLGQLQRRESTMESALRELYSGGLFKGRRKREHSRQLAERGFEFT